ncbi:hypothetical protein D3C79_516440 [compost metagenome]
MTEVFAQEENAVTSINEVRTYAQLEKVVTEAAEDATFTKEEVLAAITNIKENKGKNRGTLAGVSVSEMNLEQIKQELRNANSVLYKAKKRGASAELIAQHEERVEAAKARKAELDPKPEVSTEGVDGNAEILPGGDEPSEEELTEL